MEKSKVGSEKTLNTNAECTHLIVSKHRKRFTKHKHKRYSYRHKICKYKRDVKQQKHATPTTLDHIDDG